MNMLAKAGFNPGFELSNNELRYILWRSYSNLAEPGRYNSIVGLAKDIAMQDKLKIGNYAKNAINKVAEGTPLFRAIGEKGADNLDKADRSNFTRRVKSRIFRTSTRISNLSVAKKMDEANAEPKKILQATGWEKGTDGKWRYEVDDNMQFTDAFNRLGLGGTLKLSEAVNAPELFEAYPELSDLTIKSGSPLFDITRSSQGWFNPETNEIVITPYAKEKLETLMHEIQHWIQAKEGFAQGGNASASLAALSINELKEISEKIVNKYEAKIAEISTLLSELQYMQDKLSEMDKAKMNDISSRYWELRDKESKLYKKIRDEQP